MFNDVTAAMFKEWHIIKKNKYGKKQQRMLGIDLNKIYNRKVGERVITSGKSTKIVGAGRCCCRIRAAGVCVCSRTTPSFVFVTGGEANVRCGVGALQPRSVRVPDLLQGQYRGDHYRLHGRLAVRMRCVLHESVYAAVVLAKCV